MRLSVAILIGLTAVTLAACNRSDDEEVGINLATENAEADDLDQALENAAEARNQAVEKPPKNKPR